MNGTPYAANYTYLPGGHGEGSTTSLISAITQGSGNNAENFTYTYDNVGNITSVTQNGKLTSYAYDPLGQLIRVNDQNDLTSGENGTTWTYAYDLGGNILNKKRYAYTVGSLPAAALETVTYAYTDANWKDKLTEFNGSYITYDEIGNPTSDGEWLYAWEKGRQLKAMSKASETVVFEYNADGLRVKKIATSTGTTNYTLHGKQITHLTNGSNTLHFFYDASGKPAIVEWNNGTTIQKFAYIHNLQGDIVALIDDTGAKVVSYTYDAWGKPLSTTGPLANTLGKLNPFRYRGYVYDEETGLSYLRSRYYNQKFCRFISADSIITERKNLFTYCLNNPISHIDLNGNATYDTLQHTRDQLDIDSHQEDLFGGGRYHVDLSFAARSSLYHGGLYNCGYDVYYQAPRIDYNNWPNKANSSSSPSVPKEAYTVEQYVRSHNGAPMPGYKGGKNYENDGRNNSQILPPSRGPYREYDIYPHHKGVKRGTERIVLGPDSSWYTNNHYNTFVEFTER